MTAKANSGGAKFEGVDLFLFDPHVSIDSTDDDLKRLADKIRGKGLAVGSVVAPVWPPTGGGSAMGSDEDRKNFLTQVRKACSIAKKLRDNGIRKYGVVRIDSAASPSEWAKDPAGSTKKIAETFRQACDVAEQFGERLAAEGEICWGGMIAGSTANFASVFWLLLVVMSSTVLLCASGSAVTFARSTGWNVIRYALCDGPVTCPWMSGASTLRRASRAWS